MFTRVKAALAASGLDQYLPAFEEHKMHDAVVDMCSKNPGDLSPLIPDMAERLTFVNKFRNIQEAQETQASPASGLLLTAKGYYNTEMENIFTGNNNTVFFEQRNLYKHHETIKKSACKHTVDNHAEAGSFTSYTQQQFEDECNKIYQTKYVEKNLMRRPTSRPAIGIDLGTSNSCVAVYIKGRVEMIHDERGKYTTPSCVYVQNDGEIITGKVAKELCHRYPRNTIFDSKRLIGRPFDDPNIQRSMKTWPFSVFECNGQPKIRVDNLGSDDELSNGQDEYDAHSTRSKKRRHLESLKTFHPEEISAHILKRMKKISEVYLGTSVEAAVITVPALFNDSQRQATKDAAAIAGLKVLRIINEPTCAAIAHQLHRLDDLPRNVLVFDLGGGTFDVAVLKIRGGSVNVAAVHGDSYLGGVTFDEAMVDYCIKWFQKTYGVDLIRGQHSIRPEERAQASNNLRLLLDQCERQKVVLSGYEKTYVCVRGIDTDHPKYKMDVPFTRALFESVNEPHFEKMMKIVKEALKEAQMAKEEVNDVVLVGGSTRIPKVRRMLSEFFGREALTSDNSIHPEHAVAMGAAIQACILNGSEDVQRFTGEQGLTLSDVTPLSIGLEDGKTEKMIIWIGKNTPVPCQSTKSWYPISDNQNSIFFKVFEGEESAAKANKLLGEFELVGIPVNKAWQEEVKVTMNVSEEGILFITAKCESNGVSTDLIINTYKQRLTLRDIETAAVRNFN